MTEKELDELADGECDESICGESSNDYMPCLSCMAGGLLNNLSAIKYDGIKEIERHVANLSNTCQPSPA